MEMDNIKYEDDIYLDLLERYKEVKKASVRLLEEKRELLLRAQDAQRTEAELAKTNDVCTRLRNRTDELEKALQRDKADKVNSCSMNSTCEKTSESEKRGSLDTANERNSSPLPKVKSMCRCESAARLREVITVNHQWQDAYNRLLERCKKLESENQNMQKELIREREDNSKLRELVSKLSIELEKADQPEFKRSKSLLEAGCSSDDIEALKQQLIAYQEDFHCERQEKEKSDHQNKELKSKLRQADELIESMSQETERYKHCFNRATQEKEHLINELRRLSTSSLPMSPAAFTSTSRQRSQTHFSYPPSNYEDIIPRQSRPNLRRAPSDVFRGGDVVRDSASI